MATIDGAFPDVIGTGQAFLAALGDIANTGWTVGRQVILPVPVQPSLAAPWSVNGFGIQGKGVLVPSSNTQPYGELGKLYGGLLFGGTFGSSSDQNFALPAPSALTNIALLWDGTQDPPFPVLPANAGAQPPTGGYFAASQPLPQPQQITLGEQLAIGLWLTPALANDLFTFIYQVSWAIDYEIVTPAPPITTP